MAQVFGSAGKSAFAMGDARYRDMISRIAMPMLAFLLLLPIGYFLLTNGHLLMGMAVAAFYVFSIKSLEETGLKLKKRIFHADTGAKAEQAVAQALQELPDDFYVFHDLEFPGFNIDHVVLGPNGIFLVETKSQEGNITQENDVLLRNGRKFFKNFLNQCWSQAYSLRDRMAADGLSGLSIKPILCFSRGFVEIRGPVRGVAVINVRYLRQHILSQRGRVSAQTRDQIIPLLAKAVSNQAAQPNPLAHRSQTGSIVCPKCYHERTKIDDQFCSPAECPKCGVIYTHAQSKANNDAPSAQTVGPSDLTATLQAFLSDLISPQKIPATNQIQWPVLTLKLAACALTAILLIGTFNTIRATVTSIFKPTQATQGTDHPTSAKQHQSHPVAFPVTHAVSSDTSAKAITFIFKEDRGQDAILLFFDTKAKTLALRACIRANEKLTTTLPRVDLGYIIVTGPVWQGYEELFGPKSEARKALITLNLNTKADNVAPIRATSSIFVQKGAQSPLPETKAWIQNAFKKSGGFMKM